MYVIIYFSLAGKRSWFGSPRKWVSLWKPQVDIKLEIVENIYLAGTDFRVITALACGWLRLLKRFTKKPVKKMKSY